MQTFDSHAEEALFKILSGLWDAKAMENWAYTTPELETELSLDNYLEIISYDYAQPSINYDLPRILSHHITSERYDAVRGRVYEFKLRQILNNIVASGEGVEDDIASLFWHHSYGSHFLENIAYRYGLTMDDHLSQAPTPTTISTKRLLKTFYPEIIIEAERVLTWLDNREIIIISQSNKNYDNLDYTDTRLKKVTSGEYIR